MADTTSTDEKLNRLCDSIAADLETAFESGMCAEHFHRRHALLEGRLMGSVPTIVYPPGLVDVVCNEIAGNAGLTIRAYRKESPFSAEVAAHDFISRHLRISSFIQPPTGDFTGCFVADLIPWDFIPAHFPGESVDDLAHGLTLCIPSTSHEVLCTWSGFVIPPLGGKIRLTAKGRFELEKDDFDFLKDGIAALNRVCRSV